MVFLLIFIVSLAALCFYNFYYKRLGLPPGPIPFPILGNMPQLATKPPGTDVLFEWRAKYGPVFTYWMGEKPVIAFADYDIIHKTFDLDGDNYTGRDFFPEFYTTIEACRTLGISGTEGERWKEQRAFLMKCFRNLGMTKGTAEEKIGVLNQIHGMFNAIDQDIADGVKRHKISEHIDLVLGNMSNIFLFGHSFNMSRNEFSVIRSYIDRYMGVVMSPAALLVMSHPHIFRHLPYFKGVNDNIEDQIRGMTGYMRMQVKEHLKEMEKNSEMEDYVSLFLKEIDKRDGALGFDLDSIDATLMDLWIASQETTSNTLNWGMVYSIHWPEKQRKLHEELDRVINSDRLITQEDRPMLPYTSAFCNEIQRLANILPQNILRRTQRDTTVNGYPIKAGTSIMGLFSLVLYDPDVFKNPLDFQPERFLHEDGSLKKIDQFIPFSTGRRVCAGEALAKIEIFLNVANLFNRYEVRPVDGGPKPSMKRNFGFSIAPEPFEVELKVRF